jgi:two-component system sensor histidine kinase BaeS
MTAAFAAADVSALATRQHAELTSAIAVAAGAAWDRNESWAAAGLSPVLDLAARVGADIQIRDRSGHVVASSPGFGARAASQPTGAPIVVRGERAGEAVVRFTGAGLGSADRALEVALLRAIAGAAGLAALAAMLTGLAVARRITRPVEKIIAVTRAMGRGQRAARAGPVTGPGELRELAAAFDQMADTMDRQEQLRRDLVADVAHELRTPVAVLQAGHEALLDGLAEPTRTSWPRCAMRCCDWRAWSPTCRTWPRPTPPGCTCRGCPATWRRWPLWRRIAWPPSSRPQASP